MAKDGNRRLDERTVERRRGGDRRQRDVGPPAGRERRRNVEMRRPDVQELDLTMSEWGKLLDDTPSDPSKR